MMANGIGGTTGDRLVSQRPLYTGATIRHLDNSVANASDTNSGVYENAPWATLNKAATTMTTGQILVVGPGHNETLTANTTFAQQKVCIVGSGSSAGIPTPTFSFDSAGKITMSGADPVIRGLRLQHSATSSGGTILAVSGDFASLRGLYVEMRSNAGSPIAAAILITSANRCRVESVHGVAIQAVATNSYKPYALIEDQSAVKSEFYDVTIDAGQYGFSSEAIYVSGSATKQVVMENLTALRGADVGVNAAIVQGWIGYGSATSEGHVLFF